MRLVSLACVFTGPVFSVVAVCKDSRLLRALHNVADSISISCAHVVSDALLISYGMY